VNKTIEPLSRANGQLSLPSSHKDPFPLTLAQGTGRKGGELWGAERIRLAIRQLEFYLQDEALIA